MSGCVGCKCDPKVCKPANLMAGDRKQYPITTGVLDYFPDAVAEIAHVSLVGNEQHNAGQPVHWAKHKSSDEADALVRHLLQRGELDSDGLRHTAKVAWRALALLQREIEAERQAFTTAIKAMDDPRYPRCDGCSPDCEPGQCVSD